jgi:hypothetical protein
MIVHDITFRRPLRRQANASVGTVLLEDAAEDDTLIDPGLLEAVPGDVADAIGALLQHAKVELTLAADVVRDRLGLRLEVVETL